MKNFFSGLRKVEVSLTIFCVFAFVVMGFMQVFFRVVVKNPLSWTEEACKYFFIWSTLLGAVLVSARNEHFFVDMFLVNFPKKVQRFLKYFSYVIIFIFSLVLIYFGIKLMFTNTSRLTPVLEIKIMYVYTIIPLNGILVILHLFESIYNELQERRA